MKHLAWMTALILLCALALPAFAQRGSGNKPANSSPAEKPPIRGKVLSVDAQKNIAKVALYVYVDKSDAPGKVPEVIANLTARLSAKIDEITQQIDVLKKRGKEEQASKLAELLTKLRERIEEAKHWREVEAATSPDTVIIGMVRSPVNTIPVGTLVQIFASVDGQVAPGTQPTTVDIISPVNKIDAPKARAMIIPVKPGKTGPADGRGKPNAAITDKTYFQILGKVTGVNPLTLDINGAKVIVNIQQKISFYQHMETMAAKELKPGFFIVSSSVEQTGNLNITKINELRVSAFDSGPSNAGGLGWSEW